MVKKLLKIKFKILFFKKRSKSALFDSFLKTKIEAKKIFQNIIATQLCFRDIYLIHCPMMTLKYSFWITIVTQLNNHTHWHYTLCLLHFNSFPIPYNLELKIFLLRLNVRSKSLQLLRKTFTNLELSILQLRLISTHLVAKIHLNHKNSRSILLKMMALVRFGFEKKMQN